jgi:hypothetical protein
MFFVNTRDLDLATRDEHSTVDLEARTASRACPFLGRRGALLVAFASWLTDTSLGATTVGPATSLSLDVQTGLLALDGEAARKEAKGEAVPENAENAFVVAARRGFASTAL